MRRVLTALAMIAACVFIAAPAIAQDDSAGSTEPPASTEAPTTPPSEDPPALEDVPENPPAADGTETPEPQPEPEPEAAAQKPAADDVGTLAVVDKVTICHRRAAETNPYGPKAITVSVNSIFNPNNGHDTHNGPVFPAANWGDIIPPFEAESGSYPGQNWDAEGQAIFFNNCQPDDDPPPPGDQKVPICHARNFGQGGDPYNRPNPSVDGILNGHAGHTGPVFFPGIDEQWGDIIPPFEHEGGSFPGLNWDADGQAIYFNNCNVTDDGDDDDGDDDGDDGDDDGDEGDGDDDGDGALPDTGGQSPWILLTGGLLSVLGIAILSNGTLGREQVVGRHVQL